MIAALLTALCWSISALCSARAARYLGGPTANRTRLLLATSFLLIALISVVGMAPLFHYSTATSWFLISGAVGLGIGDACLFVSYTRLGMRLPAILTHCLATPLSAVVEWLWLGNVISGIEVVCIAVILGGVVLALWPDRVDEIIFEQTNDQTTNKTSSRRMSGILFGVASAIGLAGAAVLSRRGYADIPDFPWLEAAVWRNIGGVSAACALWLFTYRFTNKNDTRQVQSWSRAWPWIIGTAALGPAIGVGFYQIALQQLQAGQVQAILSIVPILIIPMAWLLDGDRPSMRSIIGGIIGVIGVIWMALVHTV